MGKINYRTDDINKKLKQIDELVGSNKNLSNQIDELVNGNKNLSNQINNFNSQLDNKTNLNSSSVPFKICKDSKYIIDNNIY